MIIGADTYQILVETAQADRALNALRSDVAGLRTDVGSASQAIGRMEQGIEELGRQAEKANKSLEKNRTGILQFDAAANLAARGLGVLRKSIGLLSQPIGLATEFEKEVALIDTISNNAGSRFQDAFLEQSQRTGIAAAEIARATYQAISASIAEEQANEFVEISSGLARVGNAQLTPTLDLLATLRNQYSLTIEEVRRAAGTIFTTTRLGRTTIAELGASFGQIIPFTRGAKQSIEETSAALAALTQGGIETSIAATQLRAFAVGVAKNSDRIAAAITKQGKAISASEFQALSFIEQIRLLTRAFGDNQGQLIKLFGRIEGAAAVMNLGANNAAAFQRAIDGINASTDDLSRGLDRVGATAANAQARTRATYEKQLIELGRAIMPQVNQVLTELIQLLRDNGQQVAELIIGIARGAVALGEFVSNYGKPILVFFGALLAQSAITRAVGLATALGGIAKAISPIGVAASASALGVGKLATAIGGLSAALPLLVIAAQRAGEELGQMLTKVDLVEQHFLAVNNAIAERRIQQSLGSFESVDALQARRQEILAGDRVLLDPSQIDDARGVITRVAAEGTESIAEVLERGFEQASEIVGQGLAGFERAATIQRQREEEALDRAAASQAQLADLNNQIRAYESSGNVVALAYFEALDRRRKLEAEISTVQVQVEDARKRAVELEEARAKLSVRFQREATQRLADVFVRFEQNAPGLVALGRSFGQLASGTLPPVPQEDKKKKRSGPTRAELEEARQERNARNRIGALDDADQRSIALQELRFETEVKRAKKHGDDLTALLARQARERADLEERIERTKSEKLRQVREADASERVNAIAKASERELAALVLRFEREIEEAQRGGRNILFVRERQARELDDRLRQLDDERQARIRQRRQIELDIIEDANRREIESARFKHEEQLRLAREAGASEREIALFQQREITAIIERQNERRTDSYFLAAQQIGQTGAALFDILETIGIKGQLLTGLEIIGEGVFLQAKAIRYGIQAGERFLSGDILRGIGFTALAAQAQAGAVKQYAMAAELGAGGGPSAQSTAPTAPGGAGTSDRRPSVQEGQGSGPLTLVIGGPTFNGDVYDTRAGATRAFGRRAIESIAAIENERGLPRFNLSRFGT